MREIVLDTETTGLDPYQGHRLVEVGCVELINRIPSGQTFHRYLNPERDIPTEAFSVHGLSEEFLKDKPPFAEIAEDFLAFVSDARLVIHNAGFDIGFLNAELERAGHRPLARDRLVDTLLLARRVSAVATDWTTFACVTASTTLVAPSTGPCSMPSYSPRSTWSSSKRVRPSSVCRSLP